MARKPGTLSLASNIEPRVAAPIDGRERVALKSDLTAEGSFPYFYEGMQVYVVEEQQRYTLIGDDPTDIENWRADGTSLDVTVYQPGGSYAFENIPALTAANLGFVYNITNAFTTTASFLEGAGIDYPAGTDVAIVNAGTAEIPVYKYNALGGVFDGYQTKLQFDTMPTAAAGLEGIIYEYTGETTASYTNGYFYQCIEDPDNAGSYIWVEKSTQAGSNGALDAELTATKTVGGINSGTVYAQGTSFETLWRNLLNPVEYPTFTNPSASISATGNKLLEVGATLSTTITATLNRGTITPAYGTSGYRSGAATDYALNGGSAQAGNTFNETVDGTNKSFTVVINYAAGEQPKDSIGNNYSSPLAAGSVTSNTINWEFVNAIWSNDAAISTIAKDALVSKSAKVKQFNFPAATVANPEVFDIPASWTVTAVEVLNTLSNQWESCAAEFTITDTTHDDAGGNSTAYKRYTNNLGYAMDSRSIRVKWS